MYNFNNQENYLANVNNNYASHEVQYPPVFKVFNLALFPSYSIKDFYNTNSFSASYFSLACLQICIAFRTQTQCLSDTHYFLNICIPEN